MKRYRLLFPLLICLLLTACGGKKEAEGPSGIVYVPQAVPGPARERLRLR